MAKNPGRGENWSWWPMTRFSWGLLATLVVFLAIDFIFVHRQNLSTYLAFVIAAPYVVLIILGWPSQSRTLSHRRPPRR